MLCVIILDVVVLSAVILSVVMLNAIIMSVVALSKHFDESGPILYILGGGLGGGCKWTRGMLLFIAVV
jgi:hypothetical protein